MITVPLPINDREKENEQPRCDHSRQRAERITSVRFRMFGARLPRVSSGSVVDKAALTDSL